MKGLDRLLGGSPAFQGTRRWCRPARRRRLGFAAASLTLCLFEHNAAATRVVYLLYPDGATSIPAGFGCQSLHVPPAYSCHFGGTAGVDGCKQRVQGYLDRFYADFDIEFTWTEPSSGPFYTVVITSGWPQCAPSAKANGVAPLKCSDWDGNVAYVFDCGDSAKRCAAVIAQEQAHLVGLEHTESDSDVMYPYECESCDGFENQDSFVFQGVCGPTQQNSYRMMFDRIGAFSGVPKGGARCVDSAAPVIEIVQPVMGTKAPSPIAVTAAADDECGVRSVTFASGGTEIVDYSPPYTAQFTVAPRTEVTITATAEDNQGLQSTTSVTVTEGVPDPPPPPPPKARCLCTLGRTTGLPAAKSAFLVAGAAAILARRHKRPPRENRSHMNRGRTS